MLRYGNELEAVVTIPHAGWGGLRDPTGIMSIFKDLSVMCILSMCLPIWSSG